MSINMKHNFIKLLLYFREQNLDAFYEEHVELYAEARKTGNFIPCTAHYYKVMSKIINQFFNGNFHFTAPLAHIKDSLTGIDVINDKSNAEKLLQKITIDESIPLEKALYNLHCYIGQLLNLKPKRTCIDIGCGIGGVMLDLAETGAFLTGLTVAIEDVKFGTELLHKRGYSSTCQILESSCQQHIPLDSESQDAAYAIYALKYFPNLEPVLQETVRVLKRNALFVVYDIVKTNNYDPTNSEHVELLKEFEFACGMPALHTRDEMIREAQNVGFRLLCNINIDKATGFPFYYCFSHSPFFMWLLKSRSVNFAINLLEWLRILPHGFSRFNNTFLAGTVLRIVRAGEMEIISGGEIFLFQKT